MCFISTRKVLIVHRKLSFSKLSIVVVFAITAFWADAQNAVIRVLSAENEAPIEFVHLIFTDSISGQKKLTTTDVNGNAPNIASETCKLLVTFVGYESITTTVQPGKSYTFRLKPGTQNLEEVVVTAQYAPVAAADAVYKIQVLNREQIDNRAAITLNQLLNDQLNIRITQDNILGSGLQIQGLGDNNLKILIDGVPVSGRLNGNIDLSQINLDNIERIEVIEGPMSVVYGSNALGGTINLITKKPEKNHFEAGAKGFYESVGVYNFNAWGNAGGKSISAKVDLGRNFFDGYNPEPYVRWQQWKQKEQRFGNFQLKRDFKKWSLTYTADALWELIKDKGDRRSAFTNYAFDSWYTTNRYMQTLAADVTAIPNHRLNVLTSYTWYSRSKITYNRDLVHLSQEITANPTDHDTTTINAWLMRGTLSSTRKKALNYQIGLDLNWENTRGARINGVPEIGDYAAFGSLQYKPTKKWLLQPALRYAYNTAYQSPVIPAFNAQYRAGKNWQVRFGYARGFRAPSLKELYLYFVDANHDIVGNVDLLPENSNHLNLNAIYIAQLSEVQKLKIEPGLFYNRLRNMINLTQIQGTAYTYLNIDQYTTFGAKIMATYSIHPDFNFALGYSHLGFSNQVFEETGGEKFLYTPEVTAAFNYWRASKKFRFNITYKYNGDVPGFRVGDDGTAVQTLVPAYQVFDITSAYSFWKNRITLSAGAKNLFNVTNLDVLNASGGVHSSGSFPVSWGRTWFVSTKFVL